MGGTMSIERLIIDSNDMSEWTLESAWGSGYEALDDSPRPKVLALLARGYRTKILKGKVVAPGVVGGLLMSYMR